MRPIAVLLAFLVGLIGVSVAIAVDQAPQRDAAGQVAAGPAGHCAGLRARTTCQPQQPAAATEVPPPSSLFAVTPVLPFPPSATSSSAASPTPAGLRLAAPASSSQQSVTLPPNGSDARPDGIPAGQVGALVLDDSAADLWTTWHRATLAGTDCEAPGTIALRSAELDLTTDGTFGNCAEITSDGTYRFGIFEARIWVQAGPNGTIANWPAFWLVGRNWPVDGEIDAFEGLHGFDSASFHFGAGNSSLTKRDSALKPGWNTVDVVWKPQVLAVYDNGRKFVEWDSAVITSQPMRVIFDSTTGAGGYTTGQPSTLAVDYVRIWTAA